MRKDWQVKRLCDVCHFDKTQGIHRNLPYVGLEHIESHTGRFIGSTEPQAAKSSTFRFSNEHILYGRLRPYLNKVLAPDFDGHCSTEIFPIKPDAQLLREYLLYWFLSGETVERINETCTGARMPRADMNEVLEFEFPLPSLPEQRRIVGILDETFAGIATAETSAEKNLQNARALFESHLQSVFAHGHEGWTEMTLEAVAHGDCSLSYGIVQPGDERDGGLPIVRPTDLTEETIRLEGLKRIDPKLATGYNRTTLKGGDLLLCVRGSTGVVSRAALELVGSNVTRGIVPIRFNASRIRADFGFHMLRAEYVQGQIREKTYGAALMQINIGDLRLVSVIFPPPAEQRKIAVQLDALSAEIHRLESLYQQKLDALNELKKSLLHQAFTGQL